MDIFVISNLKRDLYLEKIQIDGFFNFKGIYFFSLSPKFQKNIMDLIEEDFLGEDMVFVVYQMALNFEVVKYINYVYELMKFNIHNFDPDRVRNGMF